MEPMPSVSACSDRPRRALLVTLLVAVLVGPLGCAHGKNGREPPTSLLEVASETTDADVWVDGQYVGQVSEVSGRLKLAPGVHRVEIRKPGYFPVQRTVRIDRQGGGVAVVEAELLTDPR